MTKGPNHLLILWFLWLRSYRVRSLGQISNNGSHRPSSIVRHTDSHPLAARLLPLTGILPAIDPAFSPLEIWNAATSLVVSRYRKGWKAKTVHYFTVHIFTICYSRTSFSDSLYSAIRYSLSLILCTRHSVIWLFSFYAMSTFSFWIFFSFTKFWYRLSVKCAYTNVCHMLNV